MAASPPPVGRKMRGVAAIEVDTSTLPLVGVLDTGVPANHVILNKYERGKYISPTSAPGVTDDYGSFVSCRVVFGDPDYSGGLPAHPPVATARLFDINVRGMGVGEIEDKAIFPALKGIVSTAPDVRVFNMSFDSVQPMDLISPVKRSELLRLVQDLDNFIFQNDIVVVVAAGNSRPGLIPPTPDPGHFAAPDWAFGAWGRSFNSLTCGLFLERLTSGGLVTKVGWPSPFCPLAPGLFDTPKPDFSSKGG